MGVEAEVLTEDKCRELICGAIIGRIAFATPEGLRVIPVNYTTVNGTIIFRTAEDSLLGRYVDGAEVAFEIDHVDYADKKGWSVLAVGTGELVEDPGELADDSRFWNPHPWAAGERGRYLRIRCRELSGRRLGGGWTRANELPVRRRPDC